MCRLGRLKKRPEFLRVAGKGRKIATPGLVLQALERVPSISGETAEAINLAEAPSRESDMAGASPQSVRVGFTASRKVGGAVQRNRARRRLKAAVAELMPEAARPGRDYVVVARQGTLHRPWQDLLEDLRGALGRVETAGRSGGGPRGRKPGRRADSGPRRGAPQAKEAG